MKYTHLTIKINKYNKISQINEMIMMEYGTSSCIKSRVNRLNILSILTSAREVLKLYNKTPPNGLIIKISRIDNNISREYYEPNIPNNNMMYMFDNYFH